MEIAETLLILRTASNVLRSNAFGALRKPIFFNANVANEVKASVYESLVLPIALYGSESWCLTKNYSIYDVSFMEVVFVQSAELIYCMSGDIESVMKSYSIVLACHPLIATLRKDNSLGQAM